MTLANDVPYTVAHCSLLRIAFNFIRNCAVIDGQVKNENSFIKNKVNTPNFKDFQSIEELTLFVKDEVILVLSNPLMVEDPEVV